MDKTIIWQRNNLFDIMIIFKPSSDSDNDFPLTWRNYKYQEKILECSPVIVCPNGHYLSIHKHTISEDGTVTPSVICPVKDCTFHEFIKLEKWCDSAFRQYTTLATVIKDTNSTISISL